MTEVNHRCAVLGKPIAHSLSPVLHNAAYHALHLDDWSYDKHEVGEPDLVGTQPDHAIEENDPAIRNTVQYMGQRAYGCQYRGV